MRLHTDTVDKSLCLEVCCHFDDSVHLAVHVFVVVIVVELTALRRILSCESESRLDK